MALDVAGIEVDGATCDEGNFFKPIALKRWRSCSITLACRPSPPNTSLA